MNTFSKKAISLMLTVIYPVAACNNKQTSPIRSLKLPNAAAAACKAAAPAATAKLALGDVPRAAVSLSSLSLTQPSVNSIRYTEHFSSPVLNFDTSESTSAVVWRACTNDRTDTCYPEQEGKWVLPAPGAFELPRMPALEGKTVQVRYRACTDAYLVKPEEVAAASEYFQCENDSCFLKNGHPDANDIKRKRNIYVCSAREVMAPLPLERLDESNLETQTFGQVTQQLSDLNNVKLRAIALQIIGAAETYLAATRDVQLPPASQQSTDPLIYRHNTTQNLVNMGPDLVQGFLINEWESRRQGLAEASTNAALALADAGVTAAATAVNCASPGTTTGDSGTGDSGTDGSDTGSSDGSDGDLFNIPTGTGTASGTGTSTTTGTGTSAGTSTGSGSTSASGTTSGTSSGDGGIKTGDGVLPPGNEPNGASSDSGTKKGAAAGVFLLGFGMAIYGLNEIRASLRGETFSSSPVGALWGSKKRKAFNARSELRAELIGGTATPASVKKHLDNLIKNDPNFRDDIQLTKGQTEVDVNKITIDRNKVSVDGVEIEVRAKAKIERLDALGHNEITVGGKDTTSSKEVKQASLFKAGIVLLISAAAFWVFDKLIKESLTESAVDIAVAKLDTEFARLGLEADAIVSQIKALEAKLATMQAAAEAAAAAQE